MVQSLCPYIHGVSSLVETLYGIWILARVIGQSPFPRGAAAGYSTPPADGSRPGIFQYPLRIEWMTKFAVRSLVHHETVPGHHFDLAQVVENKDLPAFRQLGTFGFISARGEGWGLYAEHLAAESGWYEDDLEGLLGELWSEEFRARRLVVDTGSPIACPNSCAMTLRATFGNVSGHKR